MSRQISRWKYFLQIQVSKVASSNRNLIFKKILEPSVTLFKGHFSHQKKWNDDNKNSVRTKNNKFEFLTTSVTLHAKINS